MIEIDVITPRKTLLCVLVVRIVLTVGFEGEPYLKERQEILRSNGLLLTVLI